MMYTNIRYIHITQSYSKTRRNMCVKTTLSVNLTDTVGKGLSRGGGVNTPILQNSQHLKELALNVFHSFFSARHFLLCFPFFISPLLGPSDFNLLLLTFPWPQHFPFNSHLSLAFSTLSFSPLLGPDDIFHYFPHLSLALMFSTLSFSLSSCCCSARADLCRLFSSISFSLACLSASSAFLLSSTAASFASFSSCFLCLSSYNSQIKVI